MLCVLSAANMNLQIFYKPLSPLCPEMRIMGMAEPAVQLAPVQLAPVQPALPH